MRSRVGEIALNVHIDYFLKCGHSGGELLNSSEQYCQKSGVRIGICSVFDKTKKQFVFR
jgi:hypothetical protein